MTANIPPDRTHLAAMLKVFARSAAHFGVSARRELLEYIGICEDTIEAQAAMLRADLTDLVTARRLKAENATLRQLVEAALVAGQIDDGGESASIIREALERTS
jgi:hypothetical protein